jgi:hypothetical protein
VLNIGSAPVAELARLGYLVGFNDVIVTTTLILLVIGVGTTIGDVKLPKEPPLAAAFS